MYRKKTAELGSSILSVVGVLECIPTDKGEHSTRHLGDVKTRCNVSPCI